MMKQKLTVWAVCWGLMGVAGPVSAVTLKDLGKVPDNRGRIVLKKKAARSGQPTASGYGINYHHGPILKGPVNFYYVWYGDWSNSTTPLILTDFVNAVGGSPWWNILSTYSTSSQVFDSRARLAGSYADNYSYGKTLSDGLVYGALLKALNSQKLPMDADGVYVVFTSKDVKLTSGMCRSYCGWHSYGSFRALTATGVKSGLLQYALVPDPSQCLSTCAAQPKVSPNDNPAADAMVSTLAHELAETVSDPRFTGWFDSRGYENADKCSWNFVKRNVAANGSFWNVQLGARKYYLQGNWVNAQNYSSNGLLNGYCGLGYP